MNFDLVAATCIHVGTLAIRVLRNRCGISLHNIVNILESSVEAGQLSCSNSPPRARAAGTDNRSHDFSKLCGKKLSSVRRIILLISLFIRKLFGLEVVVFLFRGSTVFRHYLTTVNSRRKNVHHTLEEVQHLSCTHNLGSLARKF